MSATVETEVKSHWNSQTLFKDVWQILVHNAINCH